MAIEKQIFELEEAYYNETPTGNVMKGWGEFLDAKPGVSGPPKRKMEDESRMFSYSSWTFWCVPGRCGLAGWIAASSVTTRRC